MAVRSSRIQLTGAACILGALMLLQVPLRWMLAWAVAAGLHELGHLAALGCMGCRVGQLRVGASGMVMETGPLTRMQELLAAAAGPAVSLSLLLLCRSFPRVALCGLAQGLYNLLPVRSLDGGRIMKIFLAK